MDRSVDGDRFAELIGSMAETYRRDLTAGLVEGYWLALRDLPLAAVERGAEMCLRECQFMPAPVEIRERSGAAGSDQAEQAWEALLGAIRKTAGEDVTFEDGAIALIVGRMGGWEHVTGLSSEELLKWGRKEFLGLYRSHVRQGGPVEPTTVHGWLAAGSPKGCTGHLRIRAPYLEPVPRVGP